ncbi:hypothetical protein ACHHV8_04350 [Paenibacillus sp. TAB 01]
MAKKIDIPNVLRKIIVIKKNRQGSLAITTVIPKPIQMPHLCG